MEPSATSRPPRPLPELPSKNIRAVFSDLDDTLTDASQIRPETYRSFWRLKEKGYWLVIVSGRPAGWADCLMRLWPIDAMIFENGAGLITRHGTKLETQMMADASTLKSQTQLLEELYLALKTRIPHLKLASDQPYRLFDYAIDYTEEPPHLTATELDEVLRFLKADPRITAKLSSIHVNYWCGTHTKVTACARLLADQGPGRKVTREQVVFCGDSPNDEPLFDYFDHSVGVANIETFLSRMTCPPKHLTKKPGGTGFQEIVSHLLTP